MESTFFVFYIPAGDSSQKVLSTSYTEMRDNLTDSEQENVLKVLSGRSKKYTQAHIPKHVFMFCKCGDSNVYNRKFVGSCCHGSY